ncbi:hypothetical protein BCR33DRAFT_763595 [Rhizoclosmatium globosum]|uniref:Transmembrane protein n=1 Tax=Rhizoclosmatium globosum TaxID=329046 RepID=A0A1Y2CQF5_9FUNG|nr:hypothetical protein BCR33DRAFT_763595 [Rhizoclosmatium globosum]|eukprot:ORY49187.1 hypothetical protein BCR33DRAFT_763595 [Rhizoclosmatium globosum]
MIPETSDGPFATAVIFCIMGPLNMIALIILTRLILEYDIRQAKKRFSFKQFFSPMNRILILAISCLMLFYICMAIQRFHELHTVQYKVGFVFEKFFLAIVETCGIYYSWIRGEAVVDIITPKFYNSLKYSVLIFPAFFFLQVIPTVASVTYYDESTAPVIIKYAEQGSIVIGGLIVCFFDTAFTFVFLTYMQQHKQLTQQDKKLYTISKYSVIATVTSFSAVFMYAAGFAFNSSALFDFSPNLISFTFWILVRMKYKLYKIADDVKSQNSSVQPRKPSVAVMEASAEKRISGQFGRIDDKTVLSPESKGGGSLPRNVRSSILKQ